MLRNAVGILKQRGVGIEAINYYENPMTSGLLRELLGKLGLPARDVVRWKEPLAGTLGINREMSDDELIPVLVDSPDLLQRPIVVRGERAILARPFQKVETLI